MSKAKKFFPELVYGAVDGTVTTFAIVAASVGAGLSSGIILVLGIANLLADGFSMGASSYLSAQADDSKKHHKKDPVPIGIATFSAFTLVGLAPIAVYIYDVAIGNAQKSNPELFYVSIFLTAISFAAIGLAKSRVEKTSTLRAVFETVGLGAIAALLSYFAGDWLASMLGVAV